jgi:hypothetical protein
VKQWRGENMDITEYTEELIDIVTRFNQAHNEYALNDDITELRELRKCLLSNYKLDNSNLLSIELFKRLELYINTIDNITEDND